MEDDSKKLAKIIGRMIRQKREEMGWSQQHLADLLAETHATRISFIERGGALPTIPTLLDICEILDLDIGVVLKESARSAGENGFMPSIRKVKEVAKATNDIADSSKVKRGSKRTRSDRERSKNHDTAINIMTKRTLLDDLDKAENSNFN